MLAQTDAERERYEARRKAQLDYNTGMKVARMEGRMEEKIHVIQVFERLLHRPETPTEKLAGLTLEKLTGLAEALEAQLLQQY